MNWVASLLLTKPSMFLVRIGKVLTESSFTLTNVWVDWGKCLMAPFEEDT